MKPLENKKHIIYIFLLLSLNLISIGEYKKFKHNSMDHIHTLKKESKKEKVHTRY